MSMNSYIAMNHSANHPHNRFIAALKLTRREELEIEKDVLQGAIEQAMQYPDLVTPGFLDDKKEKLEEVLAELALYEEREDTE